MLFDQMLVYEDRARASAAMNMAIDEALLGQTALPVLRFYSWRGPSLSFGYFGKFAEVADEAGRREIVRRWTGGGIVRHGEDVTYSLITPAGDPVSERGPRVIYAALHEAIRAVLCAEGFDAHLAQTAAPKISEACFANPVRDDLLLGGRKIAGAAQRRTRAGFLHQGSIQLSGLSKSFGMQFASSLSRATQMEEIPPQVLTRATILASEKYGTSAWLHRW